ncbi:uncharacterized protein LOC109839996 [Asparagus officinalis]|uniref:uncharacterized protein LOC109839996 n=1 Tax=Asparagus officinalis TaxID=4686 RepID=UPI00098DFF71|nr:uncharacterized protein LOC109839996 [Asparagus officinalis]
MHEIHDADDDMIVMMDIIHDIPKDIMSDITHINVVSMEVKDIITNEAIDDIHDLLGGGFEPKEMKELCMEYEGEFSSLDVNVVNNVKNIKMMLLALEYERQHGIYF